ncbi:MAG: SRPBCC domain-containing protein [Pirellula sp.]
MNAPVARVWKAITDQVSSWWLPAYHTLGDGSIITLEANAGGRLFEKNGTKELLWYTVLAVEPERSITLAGYISPKYGGPATTMLELSVVSEGNQTRLDISDALFGTVSDGLARSLHSGWKELFTEGLKTFVEK